jgi:hypothetical protein
LKDSKKGCPFSSLCIIFLLDLGFINEQFHAL